MRHILVPLYAIIIFLVFWELLVWVNEWPNYKMASPSDIWPAFWTHSHYGVPSKKQMKYIITGHCEYNKLQE